MTRAALPTPLISAVELAARLAGDLVVIDASFDLAQPAAGRAAFAASHVPGAVYAHLDEDLSSARTGRNGRHPLPDRALLAHKLGAWGLVPGRAAVVYDRNGGMYAARAWWLLRWLGHAAVTVLDGGLAAWQAAGGAVVAGEAVAPALAGAAPYPAGTSLVATVDADTLMRALGQVCLIDARAAERYRGEVEPLDPVAGHIPGALNRLFKDNLGADGCFLPPEQLRAAWAPLLGTTPVAEVVHQCGSGVTACHNLLALEVAGLGTSLLYPGSWSEWCADPARPIARG
jgi:thiosulfate/3-mercaptopyruvate sulfurtransferase